MDQAKEEWDTLYRQWDGRGPMLLDAIRQKIDSLKHIPAKNANNASCTAQNVLQFWEWKYEILHEEHIQNAVRFQLR